MVLADIGEHLHAVIVGHVQFGRQGICGVWCSFHQANVDSAFAWVSVRDNRSVAVNLSPLFRGGRKEHQR